MESLQYIAKKAYKTSVSEEVIIITGTWVDTGTRRKGRMKLTNTDTLETAWVDSLEETIEEDVNVNTDQQDITVDILKQESSLQQNTHKEYIEQVQEPQDTSNVENVKCIRYVVKRGDSIQSIAAQFNISASHLASIVGTFNISAGQVIYIR